MGKNCKTKYIMVCVGIHGILGVHGIPWYSWRPWYSLYSRRDGTYVDGWDWTNVDGRGGPNVDGRMCPIKNYHNVQSFQYFYCLPYKTSDLDL